MERTGDADSLVPDLTGGPASAGGQRFCRLRRLPRQLAGESEGGPRTGRWQGGRYLGSFVTTYPGGQLRSMLSLTSYLGSGEYRKSYLGVPIPMTNIGPDD